MILIALVTVLSQWLAPIPGAELLQEFKPTAQAWSAGHRGADFSAEEGTLVHAIGPGVVVFAGTIAGKPVISIQHPQSGLRSTYEPVTASVRKGDVVASGQAIGTLAAFGGHCAELCLHLGLRGPGRNDYRDPLNLLNAGVAVLKPLTD